MRSNEAAPPRWQAIAAWELLAITLFTALWQAIARPMSPHRHDQPKTMAYAVDHLVHGRWALPRDVLGLPATKPPLYDTLAASSIAVFGPKIWAFALPSILAGVGVAMLLALARFDGLPRLAGPVAAAAWLGNPLTLKLLAMIRPEMLHAALLTLGWWAATRGTSERRPWLAAIFWACLLGVLLTKGPTAIFLPIYAILAARLVGGRWAAIRNLYPIVGGVAVAALG